MNSNKRGRKIFFIVCLCFIAVGIIACIAGVAMGATAASIRDAAYKYGSIGGYSYDYYFDDEDGGHDYGDEWYNYETSDDFTVIGSYKSIRNLNIDVKRGRLDIIVDSSLSEIKVVEDANLRKADVDYDEEGELSIDAGTDSWGIHGNRGNSYVKIFVPKDYKFDEVDIDVGAGTLNADAIIADEMDINVGAGEADLTDFDVSYLSMKSGAGSIKASGAVKDGCDVDGGIGEVTLTLEGAETDFDYAITVGIGEVRIGDDSYSGLGHQKTVSNNAGKSIDVECGIGSVNVNFRK